jgi:hypothetical protein
MLISHYWIKHLNTGENGQSIKERDSGFELLVHLKLYFYGFEHTILITTANSYVKISRAANIYKSKNLFVLQFQ